MHVPITTETRRLAAEWSCRTKTTRRPRLKACATGFSICQNASPVPRTELFSWDRILLNNSSIPTRPPRFIQLPRSVLGFSNYSVVVYGVITVLVDNERLGERIWLKITNCLLQIRYVRLKQ